MIPRGREPVPRLGAAADALPVPRTGRRNNVGSGAEHRMAIHSPGGRWPLGESHGVLAALGVQFRELWEGLIMEHAKSAHHGHLKMHPAAAELSSSP